METPICSLQDPYNTAVKERPNAHIQLLLSQDGIEPQQLLELVNFSTAPLTWVYEVVTKLSIGVIEIEDCQPCL